MPSKRVLEKFLDGLHGNASVYFDTHKGEFVSSDEKLDK